MVVDGAAEFVGSDVPKSLKAIAEAARRPRASISLTCQANPLRLQVRVDNVQEEADVVLAIAENGLESNVIRGENRGLRMGHDGVMRRMAVIGRAKKQQSFAAESKIVIEKDWRPENLSAVVLLQDRSSYRIQGAGKIAIPACAAN